MSRVIAKNFSLESEIKAMTPPIDLVHLAKQTLGDPSLEDEVLKLFVTQSNIYFARVQHAVTQKERFAAAHTIKGSARNIGAWYVAKCAERLETASEDELDAEVRSLRYCLDDAKYFIETILAKDEAEI